MAWYDSIGDGWLDTDSGGDSWWSSVGDGWLDSGDSWDWGDAWDTASDWFGSSDGGGGDSGGSSWSDWAGKIGDMFGGGGESGSSGWSNIFGAMLGGLAGGADAKLGIEMVREKAKLEGAEERRSLGFAADLEDFYKQKDKARKRAAIDTYGQFSLMDRWAPNATAAPQVDLPTKPVAGQGGY
jgi:hypothetical protein